MTDTNPHLDRIRAQFGKQAEIYARMQQTTDERSLRALVQVSGAGAEERVLDVACGPGFLTMTFAAQCRHAVGVDATEVFLAMARVEAERRGLRNIEFRSGDAERLPFDDGAFDLVACRAAFHHFPHPARVLAEMARVAGAQGRVLIADMMSSEDAAKAEYHNRMERLCDPSHARALPPSEFEQLFAAAGLTQRFGATVPVDMELEEYITHGGPDAAAEAEIRAMIDASLDADRGGLSARRQDGRTLFTYQTGVFVLHRV